MDSGLLHTGEWGTFEGGVICATGRGMVATVAVSEAKVDLTNLSLVAMAFFSNLNNRKMRNKKV